MTPLPNLSSQNRTIKSKTVESVRGPGIISNNFMRVLMQQQMEALSKMSEEDKAKLDEIFKKDQENS